MTRPTLLAGTAITLATSLAIATTATAHERDDLAAEHATEIYYNAQVHTPDGWAEAMAVADGVILATGTNEEVAQLADAATRRMDMGGETILPGLHDAHVHVLFAGMEQFACGFEPGASPDRIAQRVGECVANAQPGDWITGGNWVAAVFEDGQQNRQFLDAIAPDNPVVLVDESHHSSWANSRALELAGITRDTPDPLNGIIDRDANGEPTGLLRESAEALVANAMPPASVAERERALRLSTAQMLSYGITSFNDAGVTQENIGVLADLSESGVMKQRVLGCIRWAPPGMEGHEESMQLINERGFYEAGRFEPRCVKIVLDGVPTESHTAAMLRPYVDNPHGHSDGPSTGLLMVPQDVLNEAVANFDRQGLLIKFHAAGDGAVRAAINAVAHARQVNGAGGPMHDVGHNSFIDPQDIPRVREVNMTWEFSPYIWYPTPIADKDIRRAIGDERMERWIPIRDAVETGALVVAGSDWSVVPSVNPWLAIETMVTRQMPGGSSNTVGEGQRVDLETAFKIFTANGASQLGERSTWGSLEPGMMADFIVTETNPFEVPITSVHSTKVARAYIEGELVYDAANPPQLTAN
ncbi:amidohydrolase [Aurantiacibacter rhizosphaerae]|uniref:Amidohydrolase family protein n=1 Tax=Aurantiacibacter rhizosphaerae TaxID=2691582 RepID=A0A844XAW9_9SPHN|nr:amidohydrolase [Aurantiacibacter rhizosphaerae]MWV27547.1 amidohydrolase family protein [Aurantiacibacter rhizosphaerae]